MRCTISQIYLIKYSTCFGQVHCPSSGVSWHFTHAIGICHASSVGCLLAWSGWNWVYLVTHGYVCTARRTSLSVAYLNIQLNHMAPHIRYTLHALWCWKHWMSVVDDCYWKASLIHFSFKVQSPTHYTRCLILAREG